MTAYLSLIFILLITFVGAIMESASVQNAKNYKRADVNRAVESVFAEYQKELLEEYDIFALEGSYESGSYSEEMLKDRLKYYGTVNTEHSIKRIQFLTDDGAKAFYEQVAAYMQHKYGLDMLKDKIGMTDMWKQQEEKAEDYAKDDEDSQEHLSSLLEENEGELPQEDNPIAHVGKLKQSPILNLVMPEGKQVSEKSISSEQSLSKRKLNSGYGDFSDVEMNTGTLTKLLFGEYLLEHFSTAAEEKEGGVLDYETEYIIAGKESDRENLETVVKKLMLIRFVPNYMYLQGNAGKKAEAEALALTLCSLLAVPAITEAAAQAILLAWAYGESLVDIRTLLKGNKVPLVKTDESWQLSLAGLMKLGEEGDMNDGADVSDGMEYKEYVRMLLFLEKKETTGIRALDLIEGNLQKIHGLIFFRADQCITKLGLESTCSLRRGITYRFPTYFGYN